MQIDSIRPNDSPAALFNIEAEQQLLGAILVNNDALTRASDLLPDHFYDPVHQGIFRVIQARFLAGQLASPITLRTETANFAGISELGGAAYLVRLAGASVAPSAVLEYVNYIKSLWAKRQLAQSVSAALDRTNRSDGTALEIAADLEADLGRIQMQASSKPLSVSMLSAMTQAVHHVAEAYQNDTGLAGMSTGLKALDNLIGGLAPGRLYVVAGRPAMGKSAVSFNIATRAAMRGQAVWFGSLEMPPKELSMRFFSQALAAKGLRVPYSDIERGRLKEDEFRALLHAAKEFESLPLEIGDPSVRTFAKCRAAIKRAQDKFGDKLSLLVIDYLQKLVPPGSVREFDRVSAASEFCKQMALETNLPVMALAQLSRSVESRENKRPILSDLRGSGEIEQDADVVLFVYRDAYYLENAIKSETDANKRMDMMEALDRRRFDLEMIAAKQRGNRTGTCDLRADLAVNVIDDRDEELPFG
jgi:replicative DNA helicase